jgi:hypothetical protein
MEDMDMTDLVNRVSAAKETERKVAGNRGVTRGKPKPRHDESGDDCVEISPEARERASGKETERK